MKHKRIYACLLCGTRIGAALSQFCAVDAKRLGIKLLWARHRPHFFRWSRLAIGYSASELRREKAVRRD